MRLVVTGATGFVGSRVLRAVRGGPWDVHAVVRAGARLPDGVVPIFGDLFDPIPALETADYVVHCATPGNAARRAEMDLALLRSLGRPKRVVVVLGSSYFGASRARIDETATPRPIGLGSTFVPVVEALRASKLDWAAAFVGAVHGDGSWFTGLFRDLIAAGESVPMRDPPPIWPFVDVDDAARAIVHLLTADVVGQREVIVADEPRPLDDFVRDLGPARFAPLETEGMPPLMAEYFRSDMNHANDRLKRLGFRFRAP